MSTQVKSITDWIVDLKLGDSDAAARIWDRFFEKLCARLRQRVAAGTRIVDEEDLALSAIHALFNGAREGRFARLDSREDLWQLLVLIGSRKAMSAHRADRVRKQVGESAIQAGPGLVAGLDRVMAADVDGNYVEDLVVTCREMLEVLEPQFREVALLKLEGHRNEEIALTLGRSIRTIERHLMIIREAWKRFE